jgi:hypothetical protein
MNLGGEQVRSGVESSARARIHTHTYTREDHTHPTRREP